MSFVDDDQLTLCEDLDSIKIPAIELELRLDSRQEILLGKDKDIENLISQLNTEI